MRPGVPVRQRDAAPPLRLSAPRAARAHGYNELLHRADREPASQPSSEQQTHRHAPRATPAPPARSRMPGGKRGLVAPQNTFLENIVRRSSGESARRSEACFFFVWGSRTRTLLEYCAFSRRFGGGWTHSHTFVCCCSGGVPPYLGLHKGSWRNKAHPVAAKPLAG